MCCLQIVGELSMNKLNSMGSTRELTHDEQQFRTLLGEYLLDKVLKCQTPLEPISTFLQEKYPEMMNDIKCLVEKHHGNLADAINNLSAPQKNHLHAILGYYVIDQASKGDDYLTYRKDLLDSALPFIKNHHSDKENRLFREQFNSYFRPNEPPSRVVYPKPPELENVSSKVPSLSHNLMVLSVPAEANL